MGVAAPGLRVINWKQTLPVYLAEKHIEGWIIEHTHCSEQLRYHMADFKVIIHKHVRFVIQTFHVHARRISFNCFSNSSFASSLLPATIAR